MTVTAEALALQARMQIRLDRSVDAAHREMVRAWSRAWREVVNEWTLAIEELMELGNPWPTRAQIDRATRSTRALRATAEMLEGLSTYAGVTIVGRLTDVVTDADAWQVRMAKSQIPNAGRGITFDRISKDAIKAIVERTAGQVESQLRPLAPAAQEAMKSELVRGVAAGHNPRKTARLMLQRTEGAFYGGLSRATVIATTEMLDAHREAARQSRMANRTVKGWIWLAALDRRTCPACLEQNGTFHKAGEFGPLGHQTCRCTSSPVTKSYADLGIDAPEPPSAVPDAQAWFDKQPRATKTEIMGPKRLALYERGELKWGEMSARRKNPGWRDSYAVRSLPK